MNELKDVFIGVVRHLLQIGSGSLVAKGLIDGSTQEALIGGGIALFTLGWMLVSKKLAKQKA